MNLSALTAKKLVPVAVVDRAEDAVPLARAVLDGGLDIIEVTLRTDAAFSAIESIARSIPEMRVGAGTLLQPEQVDRARNAGAQFGVSPGLNETVARRTQAVGLPFIPGVMTPSEIERAIGMGFRLLKFFPAENAGGVKMLEALSGPYIHLGVKFIPLGGVRADNMGFYLRLPAVAAVGGSWFVGRTYIQNRDWTTVTRLTKEALDLIAKGT